MRSKVTILAVFLAFPLSGLLSQDIDPAAIVRKADEKNRGETSRGRMTMKIIRSGWERTVEMKMWSKSDEYFLIYITAPAADEGQAFLKRKSEMWNWLPSIERMIKIPPSMMMQSWMGSDFTNDDLVRQSSIVKDYSHSFIGEETVREKPCYKIGLTPLPEAPVVWGRIVLYITKQENVIWKSEYFDEDDSLINIENAYDIQKMGDREIPVRMEISPADEPEKKTVLIINEILFNQPIPDDFFSQQNMKKIH
ncbi:MAG: outer membrane lipoprotein-sorting protein [Bacteroidales bacterium]|nr:outer membrane lipoprotein-sorting protein [Bacteroidales bacterium]